MFGRFCRALCTQAARRKIEWRPSFTLRLEKISADLEPVKRRLSEISPSSQEYSLISKQIFRLQQANQGLAELKARTREIQELEEMINDSKSQEDLISMAKEDLIKCKSSQESLHNEMLKFLIPEEEDDEMNAIVEVRAGVGGDEASLFASELFQMYEKYAVLKGWRFEPFNVTETEGGGIRESSAKITGVGVFGRLKFESGVHRVQRVPETEKTNRVHTSTVSVAVLAEIPETKIEIRLEDLRIDYYRSSGAGGQHVNKTESAVRLTHLPTGVVVTNADERSQHKNKAKAMSVLRSRLYQAEKMRIFSEHNAQRKEQIGTGDRSERIRTYNFPQNRVTDHRIQWTSHGLEQMMEGELLDSLADELWFEHILMNLKD